VCLRVDISYIIGSIIIILLCNIIITTDYVICILECILYFLFQNKCRVGGLDVAVDLTMFVFASSLLQIKYGTIFS
jgi:hypothetical protein